MSLELFCGVVSQKSNYVKITQVIIAIRKSCCCERIWDTSCTFQQFAHEMHASHYELLAFITEGYKAFIHWFAFWQLFIVLFLLSVALFVIQSLRAHSTCRGTHTWVFFLDTFIPQCWNKLSSKKTKKKKHVWLAWFEKSNRLDYICLFSICPEKNVALSPVLLLFLANNKINSGGQINSPLVAK